MKDIWMKRKFSTFNFQLSIILIFLFLAACGKSRKPGLSDKDLFVQQETSDTLPALDFSDMETYEIPPGIKYTESRAVDPANPPVVIDIANRKLNIKKFDLSDYYTQVRYVKLKHPMPATEGNFLFDAEYHVSYEQGAGSGSGVCSQFYFFKDSIVAGDPFFGFYSYDNEGNFLDTVRTYDFPKVYDVSQNTISYHESDYRRAMEKAGSTNRNNNRFYVDDKTRASYVYNRADTLNENFLFTFGLKGDTLCRFRNYNPKPDKKGAPIGNPPSVKIYYCEGIFTIQQAMNDTVYRMTAPNRLVPAYVLNYGPYKLEISLTFDDFPKKFFPDIWKETDKYILFTYNRNYDSKNNRKNGLVTFFYSYYDKRSQQFYHFCEESVIPKEEFFIENPVPDALPFMISYANIEEKSLWVCYNKRRLEAIIKNKGFASLSPEQQNKLKTLQNELDDSEVLIMILE